MNAIPLKRLMLRDFQGGTIAIDAGGENLNIYGANGSGKTRLMSAFLWLLTGKDSLGRGDFEIKNLDATGNQEHGLEHTVEAVFIAAGNDLILKKIYHEIYSKKRGQAQAEFTGHTTDHFIDGVPVKENEYKARVSEIFGDENIFRLLTNPAAFALMPWQKQRTLLLDICGDIPDADIIAGDETLTPLVSALQGYTASKTPLDDLKKVTMGRRQEINKALDGIPIRIDESRRSLPDVTGLDRVALGGEITALEGELNGAKLRLQGVDTGGQIAPLTKELNAVTSEISRLENEYRMKQERVVSDLNRQLRDLAETIEADSRRLKSAQVEISEKKARIASLDKSLDTLRDKWNGIDGEEFQDTTEVACAACGQSLPEDRVEAAREKARAAFNMSKSERLEDVQAKGKSHKDEKDRLSHEIGQLEDRISVPLDQSGSQSEINRLTAERDVAKIAASDYTGIVGRDDLLNRRAGLEKAIKDEKDAVTGDHNDIVDEIADITPKLAEAKEKHSRFDYLAANETRIKQLKTEEKNLSREFEELEKTLFLIETFIRNKVSLLTGRINEKFSIVSFRLFNQLVNGGLEECCVFTVNGVPYDGGLNQAARTQGGLDIIRTLQKHYGIAPPVFIDQRESCTEIPETNSQVINLIVSPADKTLRIERA